MSKVSQKYQKELQFSLLAMPCSLLACANRVRILSFGGGFVKYVSSLKSARGIQKIKRGKSTLVKGKRLKQGHKKRKG